MQMEMGLGLALDRVGATRWQHWLMHCRGPGPLPGAPRVELEVQGQCLALSPCVQELNPSFLCVLEAGKKPWGSALGAVLTRAALVPGSHPLA